MRTRLWRSEAVFTGRRSQLPSAHIGEDTERVFMKMKKSLRSSVEYSSLSFSDTF
jgi:hypothetical protein